MNKRTNVCWLYKVWPSRVTHLSDRVYTKAGERCILLRCVYKNINLKDIISLSTIYEEYIRIHIDISILTGTHYPIFRDNSISYRR